MPRTEAEVAAALAGAAGEGRPIVPRGGGTKLGWGLDADGEELDLRGLDRIVAIEPGDFICVAQAGLRLADLQAELAAHGRQRLMLDPPHGPEQTVGGVVAANASGSLRHRFGAPRDLVIGARMALSDGTVAKTGGRVVKNVAGFDLARLLCGSLGTLAVITEVAFRLHPAAEASATVVLETRDPERAGAFAAAIRRAPVEPVALEAAWPDGLIAARFDSTSDGAATMARAAAGLADGGRVLGPDEAAALWARLARRPWDGDGPVAGCGVPVSAVPDLLALAGRTRATLALRAGIGVGEARLEPGREAAFVAGVTALGGHWMPRRGAFAEPARDPVALDLMRAVKARLDPAGVLSPGRLWAAG